MKKKQEEVAFFEYKNHTGSKVYDQEGDFYWGKILDDKNLVTYEAKFEEHLEYEFKEAVLDFIKTKKKLKIKE